jgi:hypothetical protein
MSAKNMLKELSTKFEVFETCGKTAELLNLLREQYLLHPLYVLYVSVVSDCLFLRCPLQGGGQTSLPSGTASTFQVG